MGVEMMRRDLDHLRSNLDRMYDIVARIARKAIESIITWSPIDLEEQIYVTESLMDLIEEQATLFIARYQPLGPELIESKSIIRVSYDLYRISRYSREIASIVEYVGRKLEVPSVVREASGIVIEMLSLAYKAYRENDKEAREAVLRKDDIIDSMYSNMLSRLGNESSFSTEEVIALLVIRHLERMADHTVYIASHARDSS